ncbi:MAG: cobalamin-binding protein [Desulfitobacterium sp.]|nr:cobalamin-binding protein [Desulfitobacterium sp.]
MSDVLEKIKDAILEMEEDDAQDFVKEAIEEGLSPQKILNEGIIAALDEIGEKFTSGEFFLLELSEGARISDLCIEILKPLLASEGQDVEKKGKVLLATVKGDLHDIGKNLVALQMNIGGYEVVDLGIDQESLNIVAKAQEINADVIALSSLMITTLENQAEVIKILKDKGIRDQFKVVVGGGPTTEEWAKEIGADGWAPDAVSSVSMLDKVLAV